MSDSSKGFCHSRFAERNGPALKQGNLIASFYPNRKALTFWFVPELIT